MMNPRFVFKRVQAFFLLTCLLLLSGCQKELSLPSADEPGGGTPGEYYYKATIGGVNYSASVTATGDHEAGSGLNGTDEVVFTGGINYASSPIPLGVTTFGAAKGIMRGYLQATDAQFKAYFAPGSYRFATDDDENGIDLGWGDNKGGYWNSRHPTLRQPATSSIGIVSVEDSYDVAGNYYIKVKLQFNCTLYSLDNGNTVELINGELVCLFGKI